MSDSNNHDQLRRMVDEALLAGHEDCVHNLFNGVASRAKSAGVPFDGAVVLEYFWGLARIGVVAVPGDALHILPFKMPRILLTDRGHCLLEKGEQSPHNPSKYLDAVRRRVARPDDVAVSYLAESVEAWRCGLNRSSTVMLGCACERLVLLLAQAIAGDKDLPGSDAIDKALEGRVFVSPLFEGIRSTLASLRSSKKLPRELGDALDRKLSAIFDHARGLRNQSGHPTGEDVSSEDAEAGLLLFPGFYELVDKIAAQLCNSNSTAKGGDDV
jgi:hypothetical protein